MGSSRDSYLKSRHKMNLVGYAKLLEKQGGKCAICYIAPDTKQRYGVLCVDHNHSTGEVRGLLCTRCNVGLGLFQDSINNLKNAIHYLGCYGSGYNTDLELLEVINTEVSDCADFMDCGETKVTEAECEDLILQEHFDKRFVKQEAGMHFNRCLQEKN